MKQVYLLLILLTSCHLTIGTSTQIFQPSDLTGLWQVDNKGYPGTMEFKNDSLLITSHQEYKSFASYHVDKSDTQNILEIHPKDQDSLNILYMKIEKLSPDKITLEIVKVSILNKANNSYTSDTAHLGSVITLDKKKIINRA